MTMNAFELHNPTSVKEAVALLDPADDYKARPLSGGQDLLTELKERIHEPERLVNLKYLPGMDTLSFTPKAGLEIGALATLASIAAHPDVRKSYRALAQAAEVVASPQIRNVGTIGGNLCQRPRCWYYRNEAILCLKKGGPTCYAAGGENKYNAILGGGPSFIVHPSDPATALVALGAVFTYAGPGGTKTVPAEKFFTSPRDNTQPIKRENILKPNEILTKVTIPVTPLGARSVYLKFRERDSMDWAVSACAVAVSMTNGKVADCRIVLGAVAPHPWRVPAAEALLKGQKPTPALLDKVADEALKGALPLAKNAYKIPLTKALVRRAILQATA